jgi:Nucleotidyl transferase AbiEii toxin, Type IV TA system
MVTYEQRLDRDLDWALREGSMHFEEKSAVHRALRKIARRLDELGIPYALAGGMAMFFHGYRRFTEDVDILVTPEGLKEIHERLEGLGYVPPFQGSKQLRDTESGVRIEFLVSGAYPGDGKPKPVAFPDPAEAGTIIEGVRCLQLPRLVELKLASGMTNPGRLKDLGDVQQLILALNLPEEFANQLNPFVQEKYRELWAAVRDNPGEP